MVGSRGWGSFFSTWISSVFQHHLLQRPSYPCWIVVVALSEIKWSCKWGSISGLFILSIDPFVRHYAGIALPWLLHLYGNIQAPAHHLILALLQGDTVDDICIVCSHSFSLHVKRWCYHWVMVMTVWITYGDTWCSATHRTCSVSVCLPLWFCKWLTSLCTITTSLAWLRSR